MEDPLNLDMPLQIHQAAQSQCLCHGSWGTPGSQVSVDSYVHCLHRQGNFWPRRKRPPGLNYFMCAAQLRDPVAAELPLVVSWAYKVEPTACETKLLRGDIRESKLSLKVKLPFSAVPQLTPENLFQMHLYWKRENTPASVELKESKQGGNPHLHILVPRLRSLRGVRSESAVYVLWKQPHTHPLLNTVSQQAQCPVSLYSHVKLFQGPSQRPLHSKVFCCSPNMQCTPCWSPNMPYSPCCSPNMSCAPCCSRSMVWAPCSTCYLLSLLLSSWGSLNPVHYSSRHFTQPDIFIKHLDDFFLFLPCKLYHCKDFVYCDPCCIPNAWNSVYHMEWLKNYLLNEWLNDLYFFLLVREPASNTFI